MEPLMNLKRPSVVALQMCIICQEKSKDPLRDATSLSLQTIKAATDSRTKLRDEKYKDAVDRLNHYIGSEEEVTLVWHPKCYAQYTDKNKIQRLQHKTTGPDSCGSSKPTTRKSSEGTSVNWEACMFCQHIHIKQKLISVCTFKKSNEILESARYDQVLRVRLSGVHDLIAAEGKYHLNCYVNFTRLVIQVRDGKTQDDIALTWLINELQQSAKQGHVLELSDVWQRYCELATEANQEVPRAFVSRRTSFKEKLSTHLKAEYQIIVLHKAHQTVLIPTKYIHVLYLDQASSCETDDMRIPQYQPHDDIFLSLIHVALKLRGDLLSHSGHKGLGISPEDVISCVPEHLYVFLQLLFQGQSLLDIDPEDIDEETLKSPMKNTVLSIAQDIVYGVSGGKKWTPKHIGLGSMLHQATRSRQLVDIFHKAGHILSYDAIKQIDTTLAEATLTSMDSETGAVIPPNLDKDTFVHFTADNIDINDASLDGKNSFHATQAAAWQRGADKHHTMNDIVPSTRTTLAIPEAMDSLIPANIRINESTPIFREPVQMEWYSPAADSCPSECKARATDIAFIVKHNNDINKTSWTHFNQDMSTVNPEITKVGYLPIIQAPAHELDTINTVIKRCMHITKTLEQKYVVLTVDQALYCKVMELKWAVPEYRDILIPRLGGLHIGMNFLKTIGTHMADSGLSEVWTESGILGPLSTEKALAGQSYARGMRAHKLTFQALWRILLPQLTAFLEEHDADLNESIKNSIDDTDQLIVVIDSERFRNVISLFLQIKGDDNPNFTYWWNYMDMVEILLQFTRAQRDGLWDLHLDSFRRMLPYFMRYDHTNYARWGSIYLAEMKQLPEDVLLEFQNGNFVVKQSEQLFTQVDPDQSQEWLNAVGKKGGGIVGITKTPSALSRWALSYNLRSQIASNTRNLFNASLEDQHVHKESTVGRRKLDNKDEDSVYETLQRFKVFSIDLQTKALQSIATKDIATETIQTSLLEAEQRGQKQLANFVKERLAPQEARSIKFSDPLKKEKAATFSKLYVVETTTTKDKHSTVKADRNILQRMITAYEAERNVDLAGILQHELASVPLSLAQFNGNLRTGTKATLVDSITADIASSPTIPRVNQEHLIIDGFALVHAIGKPKGANTFGDLAKIYDQAVYQGPYNRVDIVFDRYQEYSIKSGTRGNRSKGAKPIRRTIDSGEVPLPNNWNNFLALSENKADLARYLSQHLIDHVPQGKVVTVAGGFEQGEEVKCSDLAVNVTHLQANHEEADTRMILHCQHSESDSIVVSSRDTDVFVLLLAHFDKFACSKLFIKLGTSKKPQYYAIHDIRASLDYPSATLETILAFHALTGCDSTSFFAGHGKKKAWDVFNQQNQYLLEGLGKGDLDDSTLRSAETFICKIYCVPDVECINEARIILFKKQKSAEALPPTKDALSFHIQRSHHQAQIWRQATETHQVLSPPITQGWQKANTCLVPILTSLPAIPEACVEMLSCGCQQCRTERCKCRKMKLPCTGACKCQTSSFECANTQS